MRRSINHRSTIDYSQITPQIYLGTNACCQRHFDMTLLRRGVTADISLEAERIDAPRGVNYFLWLPTRNHTAPSRKTVELGIQTIDWLFQHNEKIYIHCKNGHGRAPTLFAAYLIAKRGMSPAQAITFIHKRRPEIHLESSQLAALKYMELRVNKE